MNILSRNCSIPNNHSVLIQSIIRRDIYFRLIRQPVAFLQSAWRSLGRLLTMTLSFILIIGNCLPAQAATQIDIVGPTGSGTFGATVTVLPNGNIVVTDPLYDQSGGITDVGAAYLFQGSTGALISMLTGSSMNDQIGKDGVVVLTGGNYVVRSSLWANGSAAEAGAVTWGSATTGVTGTVSSSNSLVGSQASDHVGLGPIVALSNGNYVVQSPNWDNGSVADAGAVTWGSGLTGVSGAVGIANSLVGGSANDQIGNTPTVVLSNGNYVIANPIWDSGSVVDAGAVTWGSGTSGVSGVISSANSLIGSTANDQIGFGTQGVTALNNGNYVVRSDGWDDGNKTDVGAVTWGSGTAGATGVISSADSLIGSTSNDQVGNGGVFALSGGNYLVVSPAWDKLSRADVGAVTWARGTTGISGEINASNSLIGSTVSDQIGVNGVVVLPNGNYVVRSMGWDNGTATDAGAATWGSATFGVFGVVSSSNSLVGIKTNDQIGSSGITALSNSNYVVRSNNWDNGKITNVGAVTWGNGGIGITGAVSVTNSLIGATAEDHVGISGVTVLANGNYVVRSQDWDNGSIVDTGAATWGNGSIGTAGVVSTNNSLVGSTTGDDAGSSNVITLTNGNYVLRSPNWDNGNIVDVGAATWGNGTTGVSGTISIANSLIGTSANDHLGSSGLTALTNGGYLVRSANWDNGGAINAGAVTWGSPSAGVIGTINSSNSLVGTTVSDTVGSTGVVALPNGNFVVRSQLWNNGNILDAGAVTWGNGNTGITGEISSTNSIVGSRGSDGVGSGLTVLNDGSYVLNTANWNNGNTVDSGAVTWGNDNGSTTGVISTTNSVLGQAPGGGASLNFSYAYNFQQLVVGRPADNIVTLFGLFAPEIDVRGNDQSIASGDISPDVVDDTDFGPIDIHSINIGSVKHTFVISNTGNAGLLLSDIAVDNPAFSISDRPSGLVMSGGYTTFTLIGAPSVVGAVTATVRITNTDSNESPYSFVVQAIGFVQQFTLTTGTAGAGSGIMTLDPPGNIYDYGTVVTVTAMPANRSILAMWSGGPNTTCVGNVNPCTVVMTKDTPLTATFDLLPAGQQALSVVRVGTGQGTVSSSPAGIDCGVACSVAFAQDSVVMLTAVSAVGSSFAGWIGPAGCNGTVTCTVTMIGNQLVTATFTLNRYALNVIRTGPGNGVVVSDPAGINCGVNCTVTLDHGTLVTLTATPMADSNFIGWSGTSKCSDETVPCVITMTATRNIRADFTRNVRLNYELYLPILLK